MTKPPAFPRALEIEATLERVAALEGDLTPKVYARLFERHPAMEAHFWRDTNDAIKGEMLSRTFEAILDFIGERRYAQHMIGTEMVTHEGYDIPREVFTTFFDVVRDTVRDELKSEWTEDEETAWAALLADIYAFGNLTPRSDVASAFHAERVARFEAAFAAKTS